MLDSFAVSNLISENLSLKDRILVSKIPSARDYLTRLLEAMRENRVVTITYCGFNKSGSYTFPIEPYCVKLFKTVGMCWLEMYIMTIIGFTDWTV